MNYSRRVAIWLLALSVQLIQACVHCGRLEMISVWLLFLKLLRATAGVRQSNGNELNEGQSSSVNQQQQEQEYLSEAVTMETSQLSEMADITDCKMDPGCTDDQKSRLSEQEEEKECFETYFSEDLETTKSNSEEEMDGQESKGIDECEGSGESDESIDSQEGISVKVKEEEQSDCRESLASEIYESSHLNDQPEKETDVNISKNVQEEQHSEPQEEVDVHESVLEEQMNELTISEVPDESCQDTERDDLSDCVHVEMAIISSDSDLEESCRSPAPSTVDKEETEENCDLLGVAEPDLYPEDQARQEDDAVTESTAESEETVMDITISESDILEQPDYPTECELQDISLNSSAHHCSLTKIPEDEGELEKSSMHNLQRLSCSTSELDKKLPQDFCVVQEIKSENVSTEHLDFRVARRQWQKIEEQTKGQVHRPMVRHGSCQSGHSFMYTPVRNIDRPRKDHDTDSLGLGDYQYTQFSPCSEDSGLDDTSYRSPYDEPENPVEREIREALEREENFRHERAKANASAGTRPGGLPHSRSEPGERGRMFNTPEDRCRSQRSSSATTHSSVRSPTYHEMTANNVIILEPDSYPTSSRNRGKGGLLSPGTSGFQEWPSDTNNVIILETSNLIIRSASEFCLSTACQETQESTFNNNPFFKLRSHSTQSLVDQEIKIVKEREEELKRQRAQLNAKERYDTVLVSPSQLQNFTYERPGEAHVKSKSSPSSPSKTSKMDRSTLSCDNKLPESPFLRVRRKSALVQRWEAGIFANHQQQD
ncbi:uncharacterized protein si:ch211-153l6.6 isoform X1 [Triplophysa dalaica]|uniref:uncharacterized protein si:ch211-153l6.6 isoform X1 n=3 Tax=Triplophysa dalaica TaxID=1582913 RepID=UPI0024E039BE|nr:uncharacterized protein si:ch211-153l6.6 isoform X1 [Triplophysa dalaica]